MVTSDYRRSLRAALGGQASAYGFTLTVWGTGAVTSARHGSPGDAAVFMFVGGALVAMAIALAIAFAGSGSHLGSSDLGHRTFAAIRVPSVAAALACGWAMGISISDKNWAFFGAGAVAVLVYEIALGVEVLVGLVRAPEGGD